MKERYGAKLDPANGEAIINLEGLQSPIFILAQASFTEMLKTLIRR